LASEIDRDYSFFLNSDLSEYASKWIAIVDGAIAAVGDRADEVYQKAREKYPGRKISVDRVPGMEVMVL